MTKKKSVAGMEEQRQQVIANLKHTVRVSYCTCFGKNSCRYCVACDDLGSIGDIGDTNFLGNPDV